MLNKRRSLALAGLAVGAFLGIYFVLVYLGAVPYTEVCPKEHQPDRNSCPQYDIGSAMVWRLFGILDSINGVITAVATAFLAYITAKLADLGREQSETTRAQLRAYIFVDEARLENVDIGQQPRFVARIKNFGQTPAYGFTHSVSIGLFAVPLVELPPPMRQAGDPENSIGPGGSLAASVSYTGPPIAPALVQVIEAGTSAFFVAGEIHYRDCFGRPQHTKYCLFSGGPHVPLGHLAAYGPGNEAT